MVATSLLFADAARDMTAALGIGNGGEGKEKTGGRVPDFIDRNTAALIVHIRELSQKTTTRDIPNMTSGKYKALRAGCTKAN
jgi:hypothetical protein